ncbi:MULTISPECIES: N-acetyl-gamma-glutamyl-phosphate reductase [Flammeovirga]|uniref:N-acetyl-gamma-glutamyl-phosphate reductase n=1 Tax=Flammeovirga aprica JL-4 TaxID=694437 RepID=A0A7X9RRU5_9BACT|nr:MULTISPECIES: N-acetyl-gamma-glutamyl-phosphate reductase [Flammeovirga]KXX71889.1 N-acetyl-gamma-glutamyl-phosphate reductase [Flammeovirga sp. SJP92]MBD0403432.1 N-acetyl-gamma-glutamyl-phosphate reductase [Flammeovirga sp. EKP202]NME68268.1 N-acetyl-gamma-glutamyl-phosphate reductase [Flammeovirga aprica JL-4]
MKVGIIGGAGMTGGELLRVLINHPEVEIDYVHSRSQVGKPLYAQHKDLFGETELEFTGEVKDSEVIFLCLGHGESVKFLEENTFAPETIIIDLSQDFRLGEGIVENRSMQLGDREFIYGLPELNKEAIQSAKNIANPGCFATAIQIALLPLASAQKLNDEVHISAITGSTGAGVKLMASTAFTWRTSNISHYKAFNHQHLLEIGQSLNQLQDGFNHKINFIPYRGNFTRGILASCYLKSDLSQEEAVKLFKDYYADAAFTHVIDGPLDLKQVVNTNRGFISVEKHDDTLLVTSAIDNLLKGAVGQAVQNMNLIFGLDEKLGLNLKPMAF